MENVLVCQRHGMPVLFGSYVCHSLIRWRSDAAAIARLRPSAFCRFRWILCRMVDGKYTQTPLQTAEQRRGWRAWSS